MVLYYKSRLLVAALLSSVLSRAAAQSRPGRPVQMSGDQLPTGSPTGPSLVWGLPNALHKPVFPSTPAPTVALEEEKEEESSQPPRIQPRIVGGFAAPRGRFPYMVYLYGGGFLCGGTLVAPTVVLTAGHCTGFELAFIALHSVDDEYGTFEEHEIVEDVAHPLYRVRAVPEHDFRLLRLATVSLQQAVVLDDGRIAAELQRGDPLTVLGWGSVEPDPTAPARAAGELMLAGVDFLPRADPVCQQGGRLVSDAMMCALTPGQDACRGDSGGPLVQVGSANTPETDVQVGVVSWGQGCGEPGFPGVYAQVSVAIDWITEMLAGWGTARRLPIDVFPPPPATTAPEEFSRSAACCGQLPDFRRAPFVRGSAGICVATSFRASDPLLPCTHNNNVVRASAAERCEQLGARLCTAREVERGVLFNAGCYVNFRHVWTRTPCVGDDVAGHFVVRGSGWGRRCMADEYGGAVVACCADACQASKEEPEPTLTAESTSTPTSTVTPAPTSEPTPTPKPAAELTATPTA